MRASPEECFDVFLGPVFAAVNWTSFVSVVLKEGSCIVRYGQRLGIHKAS